VDIASVEFKTSEDKLFSGVVWLNSKAVGLAVGTVFGVLIFIATNWSILKGADPVGEHLLLLNQYFIGYRVTFFGSLIGFGYGFILGTICGALLAWIYNKIDAFRN
jgi:ABC-type dipeptide/oligopeptide/nickel transport system permease subunit